MEHKFDHDVMAVAEAVEDKASKADCLDDLPSYIPQLLGLLVDVAVDQLVHEHGLVPELDL
eukprot:12923214-Prorocentrum_lima.AAC.1